MIDGYKDQRLWVTAYNWIKDSINSAYLKKGEPLSENRLSQEIEVSRTPIREALRALEREGYVKIVPGKGAFVAELSVEDVKEIYDIRKLLEPFAALSSAQRFPEEEIISLQQDWEAIDRRFSEGETVPWPEVTEIDQRFHLALMKYSTNKRIQQIFLSYQSQIGRFQELSAQSNADVHNTVRQHLELLSSLKQRDGEALSQRLYQHIVKSEENVLRDYFVR